MLLQAYKGTIFNATNTNKTPKSKKKIPSINWEIKDSVSPEFQREDTVHNFCITVAEFQNCI